MIRLIGLISRKHEDETISVADFERMRDFYDRAWSNPVGLSLDIDYAIHEETGEVYREVKFEVEARYRRGPAQDRHFVGGGFEFNLDNWLRKIEGRVR